MSDTYRALCAELLDELQALRLAVAYEVGCPSPEPPVVLRARAALAQPEPVAPTDEEILRCAQKHSVAYTCVDGKVIYGLAEGHDMRDDVLTFARAVLARWGTPAIEPVQVSERLPGPEDCDGEGRCWIHQPHPFAPEAPEWKLARAKYASANYAAICWLPHWALPMPAPANKTREEN